MLTRGVRAQAPVKKASGSKKPKNESDASEEEAEALSTDDEVSDITDQPCPEIGRAHV